MSTAREFFRDLLYYVVCLVPIPNGRRYNAALAVLLPKIQGCIASDRELDRIESDIKRLRVWIKSLHPLDRKAYSGWLRYFSGNAARRRRQLAKRRADAAFLAQGSFPIPKDFRQR
jgi:hypothetical protein